jgi:hypothetical protein
MRTRRFARTARTGLAVALALAFQIITTLVALGGSGGGDWPQRLFVN